MFETFTYEGIGAVVRGVAANAEFVHERAHVLGLLRRPAHIGRVKLHALISHFGDGANGTGKILLEFIAD